MNVEKDVREWVEEYPHFYFFLPDGPYGRPLDNQYTLSSISESAGQVVVSLSDGITFRFSGPVTARRDEHQLYLSGFDGLVFSDAEGSKSYRGGEVCFVGD